MSIFRFWKSKPPVVHYMTTGASVPWLIACGARSYRRKLSWTHEKSEVTCAACIAGIEAIGILTFEMDPAGGWIKCLGCGLTSYLADDVRHRFCGHCHVFHDDIWPPSRKWWIENTPKVVDARGRRIKQ